MSETTTIVTSIIGTGAAIVTITAAMLKILSTNLATQFAAVNKRIDDTNQQVRDGNLRTETLATEMHQRFDQVHRDLAENRERMAKLEGAVTGFMSGQKVRAG